MSEIFKTLDNNKYNIPSDYIYQISNKGNIKRIPCVYTINGKEIYKPTHEKILKVQSDGRIKLVTNEGRKYFTIRKLVKEYFNVTLKYKKKKVEVLKTFNNYYDVDYNTYYEIPNTYKKYYINKKGIVKDKYGYTLMTTIRKGYITVTLTLNSVRVRKSINNLMLLTFFKDYTKMYYIDDNKLNLDIINIICK